jgi:multidrug efflux pump subunit AcrB
MMWLVNIALRRPLSVAVMALLMLVLGVLSFAYMNTDIFPAINLPVVMMVWNYPGLSPYDMERRMVTISERALSTTVNAIEHMESESILGIGIVKIYFQPSADPRSSMAQVSAVAEQILHQLPRGNQPPQIIYYNASNVPVAQLNVIATSTTINVESLMGTIMAVGVGVSNGNLLITFANELREEGGEHVDPVSAAIHAGHIRFRPIIMTALAMILGMLPMALGLGKSGEQNAPLGRAVIGGLIFATAMTLFVVPTVYSIFTRKFISRSERDARINSAAPPAARGQ